MQKTLNQYSQVLDDCRRLFQQKAQDYGTSWRILRISSLTDQLYIKAKRIRSIEEKQTQKVEDNITDDYKGLINYSIMACIQLELGDAEETEMDMSRLMDLYDKHAEEAKALMLRKNHDYGEVWRDMRMSSITDLVLVKLLRIKQIEDNDGRTIVSEGLESNFMDILNYAAFASIRLNEQNVPVSGIKS